MGVGARALSMTIAGVLLAAGKGKRFDPTGQRNKLLQELPDGRQVMAAALSALYRHVDTLVVVEGPLSLALDATMPSQARRVVCQNAHDGLGASIKTGILASQDASGWLITLGDMPWIADDTIAQVADHLRRGASLVRPYHQGQPGHPVGFSSAFRAELLAMDHGYGAATVIRHHQSELVRLDVDDIGCVTDIDYPSDLPSS